MCVLTACNDKENGPRIPDPESETYAHSDAMDLSIYPGDDFYSYALGRWIKSQTPSDMAGIEQQGESQLKALMEDFGSSSDPAAQHLLANIQKGLSMKQEVQPALEYLNLKVPETYDDVIANVVKLNLHDTGALLSCVMCTDNLSMGRKSLTGGALTKEERAALGVKTESELENDIATILTYIYPDLLNNQDELYARAKDILSLELVELKYYNPDYDFDAARYLPVVTGQRVGALKAPSVKAGSGITIESLVSALGLATTDVIDEKLNGLLGEINQRTPAQLHDYMLYKVVSRYRSTCLADQDMNKTMAERRLIQFGELASRLPLLFNRVSYAKLKSIQRKERCESIMEELRDVFRRRIEKLDWMSDVTKEGALRKLNAMKFNIGVCESLPSDPIELTGASTLTDVLQGRKVQKELRDAMFYGKELKTDACPIMPFKSYYGIVNSFYTTITNELYIYPFFISDEMLPSNDMISSYATATVFAHEITHGFDNNGSYYDEYGHFNNWWNETDIAQFQQKQQMMIALYNRMEAYPGQPADGAKTLAENMADYGGLEIAYQALKEKLLSQNVDELTMIHHCREFFFDYAWLERANLTETSIKALYLTDNHSLSANRINGVVTLMDDWYGLFKVSGGALYLDPGHRVKIW